MTYDCFQDEHCPEIWRVEAIDHSSEGECYVTLFLGPNAKRRATEYAAWQNNRKSNQDQATLATV